MTETLKRIASSIVSPVELRLFAEYGAVFATAAVAPPTIIFADAGQVEQFQATLEKRRAVVGAHEIDLQSAAMSALLGAAEEIDPAEGRVEARAEDSGGRSYEDTVRLWTRNVTRGLEHWLAQGRINADRAQAIASLAPVDQVPVILEMEEAEQIYFGTYFDRSILYSVAAPGASQHLSLLAFDVDDYANPAVERVLGRHGWFRTVPNDLPHFTYLGHAEERLAGLGLKLVSRDYSEQSFSFWVPNLDALR